MKTEKAKEILFQQWQEFLEHNLDYAGVSDAYKMAFEALERSTGHWDFIRCDMYTCSECGHIYTDLSSEKDGMNYCPNCGVRMLESEDI